MIIQDCIKKKKKNKQDENIKIRKVFKSKIETRTIQTNYIIQ